MINYLSLVISLEANNDFEKQQKTEIGQYSKNVCDLTK